MKIAFLIIIAFALAFSAPYQADEFLLPGWAVSAGMGGMRIVGNWEGLSASANPALLADREDLSIAVSGGSYFESLVSTARAGFVFGKPDIKYGAALSYVGGDDIWLTTLQNSEEPLSADNRPIAIREASHYTTALDVAGAKKWRKISVGLSAKAVVKKIPDVRAFGFSLSAGTIWRPIQRLDVGLFAENISTYQLFWNDGVNETGLPKCGVGVAYGIPVSSAIVLGAAAETDYSLDEGFGIIRAGAKGTYADMLTFAVGTAGGTLCSGASLKFKNFLLGANLDYRSALGTSYSFSLGWTPHAR